MLANCGLTVLTVVLRCLGLSVGLEDPVVSRAGPEKMRLTYETSPPDGRDRPDQSRYAFMTRRLSILGLVTSMYKNLGEEKGGRSRDAVE